ncbi:MAG: ATP-binding protein [Thermoguttaceae bacterium]
MCDPHAIWEYLRVIPSDPGLGQDVQEAIIAALERQEWAAHDVFSIRLALEEGVTNAIKHGNRYDTAKSIHVECHIWPELFRVSITDEGPGFNPARVPDPTDPEHIDAPCGRGLLLMRSFMTRVQFNEKGNEVILEKERSASDGSVDTSTCDN